MEAGSREGSQKSREVYIPSGTIRKTEPRDGSPAGPIFSCSGEALPGCHAGVSQGFPALSEVSRIDDMILPQLLLVGLQDEEK